MKVIESSQGQISYNEQGHGESGTLVCLNDMEGGAFIWETFSKKAAEKGFKVIVYDYYGKGESSCIKGPYNSKCYEDQLGRLVTHLKLKIEDVIFMGIGFGCPIIGDYLKDSGKRPKGLILIAPMQVVQPRSWKISLTGLLCSSRRFEKKMDERFLYGNQRNFKSEAYLEAYNEALGEMMDRPGYTKSYVKTLMAYDYSRINEIYNWIEAQDFKCRIVWGEEDQVVPYSYAEKMKERMPRAELVVMKNAGHLVMIEAPEEMLNYIKQ